MIFFRKFTKDLKYNDIIQILTESKRPRKYWDGFRRKSETLEDFEVSEKIGQLKMIAKDGKQSIKTLKICLKS